MRSSMTHRKKIRFAFFAGERFRCIVAERPATSHGSHVVGLLEMVKYPILACQCIATRIDVSDSLPLRQT